MGVQIRPEPLFELIGSRYERRPMLITANQPVASRRTRLAGL